MGSLTAYLFQIGKSVDTYFFNTLAPSKEEAEAVQKQAEKADVVLICSYNAWKNPSAIDVTQSLIKLAKSSIVLSVRDPLDASLFSDAGFNIAGVLNFKNAVISLE